MKKNSLILLFLLCGLMLGGCGKEEGTQLVQPAGGQFEVTAPTSWQEAAGQFNQSADIELMDAKKTTFFMIVSADKSKMEGKLTDYLDSELEKINDTYLPSNMETLEAKIGDYDATLYSFDTSMQSLDVHMNVYIFETEHRFAKAYAWGMNNYLQKNQDALDLIQASVTEQK